MKALNRKGFKVRGFQVLENECIWMKAGVVHFRLCDKAYDCFDCNFDTAMRKVMATGANDKTKNWRDAFKNAYEGDSRPCRHVVTGRIESPKICSHNYACHNCAYDQMLDNMEVSEYRAALSYGTAAGYDVPRDYYFHAGHTWVRVEHGGMARVGFDDFIMRLFGTAVLTGDHLSIGSRMTMGTPAWLIEQEGKQASVLAPVSGTVLSVNQRVRHHPDIMHTAPYEEGWLCIVEPDSPKKDIKELYFGEKSLLWMENENRRLMHLMGPEYGNLAATGGEPVRDFYGYHPEVGWDRLVRGFLGSG